MKEDVESVEQFKVVNDYKEIVFYWCIYEYRGVVKVCKIFV